MKLKLGKNATIHHYRFAGDEKSYGLIYTKENFRPYHRKTGYDISVNYGGGCVYLEFWRQK